MKLVLLDRDGVLNVEVEGYVKSVSELIILPDALKALALFKQYGFTCAVVTNQSVLGRGIISEPQLDSIHRYLSESVQAHGGKIDSFFVCTDTPDKATYRRKPKPGMLIEALEKYGANADETAFVGDALTDLQAAHEAGCRRFLVKTGKGEKTARELRENLKPVTVCANVLEAAQIIVSGSAA